MRSYFSSNTEVSNIPEGREVPPGVQSHDVIVPIDDILSVPGQVVQHLNREGGILVLDVHEAPLTAGWDHCGEIVLQSIPQEDVLHCPE